MEVESLFHKVFYNLSHSQKVFNQINVKIEIKAFLFEDYVFSEYLIKNSCISISFYSFQQNLATKVSFIFCTGWNVFK